MFYVLSLGIPICENRLCEPKGLVSLGSHYRLGGRIVSLFDNQKLATARTCGSKVCRGLYVKYVIFLYAKYVKYGVKPYVKYVKYDNFLQQNRHYWKLSPTPTHGYV